MIMTFTTHNVFHDSMFCIAFKKHRLFFFFILLHIRINISCFPFFFLITIREKYGPELGYEYIFAHTYTHMHNIHKIYITFCYQ